MKKMHPTEFENYKTYKVGKKKSLKDSQPELKQSDVRKFTKGGTHAIGQTKFEARLVKFVVNTMSPLSIIEHEDFNNLFQDLNIKIISRRTLTRRIEDTFNECQMKIVDQLKDVSYVCTTTDIWSMKKRSFLGVTCHYIDVNCDRKSISLACKRFAGTHSYDRIAPLLESIHLKYGLTKEKIVATVTDNGSNFVKAFKEFGIKLNSMDDEDDEFVEEFPIFVPIDEHELGEHLPELPKHLRCASHTLNLIATTDATKIINSDKILKKRHSIAMSKCQILWNKAGRPKSAEIIQSVFGHHLSYPGATRWNSLYDSISQILKEKEKLAKLYDEFHMEGSDVCLQNLDIKYLEEYVTVMKPLALALDILQGENNIFYGFLIPTLAMLKNNLKKIENLTVTKSLQDGCIEALEKRFEQFFKLEDSDAIVATIVHPKFKLRWFSLMTDTAVDNVTIQSLKKIIFDAALQFSTTNITNEVEEDGSDFFKFDEGDADNMEDLNCPSTFEVEFLSYLKDKRINLEMINDYPTIKKLFGKFNTPLTSSASVERLFSYATMINEPKRNALSDDHFEHLVILKANNCFG